jgi:cellobiose-specific phosphotransferase system component IIC
MPLALFYIPFYFLGSLAVIYHFANGLCTFCMTWGITKGKHSQKVVTWGAAGLGGVLALMMVAAIAAFWMEGSKLEKMTEGERTVYVQKLLAIHHHDAAAADVREDAADATIHAE